MAVRDDFTAGEVLAAADLNDTFASKVDYALPVNAQTGTTYTFVAADAEKLTTASNAAAVTLTIPPASSVAWPDNTVLRVVNYGAGAVTIDGGSGVTVTNTSSTIAQYGAAVAIRTGSDAWTVVPFGGGDVPPATVSSPAATGQYTDSGVTYDYYTFTSSGTLTVDTAGYADVLVVGGGGGGGGYNTTTGHGGGGAGGYFESSVYLDAGTLTVSVGAGGAGATVNLVNGVNGSASYLDIFTAIGGGGGGSNNQAGSSGGSGGGGAATGGGGTTAGGSALNAAGNDGGTGYNDATNANRGGGGGGGASAAGGNGSSGTAGNGGAGLTSALDNTSTGRGGGGGGASPTIGSGSATDGGGAGVSIGTANAGTANTGGGGGANSGAGLTGGNGGSGVVIVRVAV